MFVAVAVRQAALSLLSIRISFISAREEVKIRSLWRMRKEPDNKLRLPFVRQEINIILFTGLEVPMAVTMKRAVVRGEPDVSEENFASIFTVEF
jgi:hypothetical protein